MKSIILFLFVIGLVMVVSGYHKQNQEIPSNIEAEQQLLGALIRNNDLIERCNSTRLSGEHFYNKLHGEIYEKINKSLSTGCKIFLNENYRICQWKY